MNVRDRLDLTVSPVVLVEQVQLCSFQIGHLLPNAFVPATKAMKKARQFVWANCRFYRPRFKRFSCRQISLIRAALLSVKGKPPSCCVVDRWVSHMSGHRGFFVRKQKSTTDAPGTHKCELASPVAPSWKPRLSALPPDATVFRRSLEITQKVAP